MEECKLTYEGHQGGVYYVPCDKVQYISQNLINTSNSSITLVRDFSSTTFKLICNTNQYCYYTSNSGNQYRYVYITDARNIKFENQSIRFIENNHINLIICFCLILLVLWNVAYKR